MLYKNKKRKSLDRKLFYLVNMLQKELTLQVFYFFFLFSIFKLRTIQNFSYMHKKQRSGDNLNIISFFKRS